MFKHELPKRIPAGILQNGTTPLLTINSDVGAVTGLFAKPRRESEADAYFLSELHRLYGNRPFKRGNLDAGRINRLFGREIKPVDRNFISTSLNAELFIDAAEARKSFPDLIK